MFALSRVLSADVTSLLLILIGPHIKTLILYTYWLKITITGSRSGVAHCMTPTRSKMTQFTWIVLDTLCILRIGKRAVSVSDLYLFF